ncbi:MAG: MFS transporter [Ruminococcaceae bacterium]|nr:MFS transporter [Oscillospiraceae bacterium]
MMATLLLIVIYLCFIALGIPDSLFGAAWPAIYTDLHLPISYASIVALLVSCGTVFCSFVSGYVIAKLGTWRVTWISTILTALALLGFSFSNHFLWFCVLAIPLGVGAGSIDTALNNYVALHYNAMQMSFLHCFYGIGVSISPYLLSFFLAGSGGWRPGYRTMFAIQACIAILALVSYPLWRVHQKPSDGTAYPAEEQLPVVSPLKLLRMPRVRAACMTFVGSCSLEHICGVWGATYLVNSRGLAADAAARIVTLYYVGIALGRLLSGLFSSKLTPWQIIIGGECLSAAAIAVLIFQLVIPMPPIVDGIALFVIGIGNGAYFPNMIHLTPVNFGRELSQSVIGTQMGSAYLGIMVMPPLFGILAQNISTDLFAPILAVMLAIMAAATVRVRQLIRKDKN